jgi:metallo-beta-lactamase family protein
VERGGKVIVPAFAVGRTQELVYDLNQMMHNGDVPRVPVYVDSPLAVNATDVFKRHLECFDNETAKFVAEARHPALDFKMLTYTPICGRIKSVERAHRPDGYHFRFGHGGIRAHPSSYQE